MTAKAIADAPWYPIEDPPPRRVEVELSCRGFTVTGWRDLRDVSGRLFEWWFERRGRHMVPLERAIPVGQMHRSPVAWRPLDASAWPHPLPAKAKATIGPNWSPPAPARPAPEAPMRRGDDPLSRFERRMLNAFRVDRALPDTDRSKLRVRINWPETRPGPGDYPPEQVTRYRPTPDEVDDYLVVMRHVARLARDEIRIVRARATLGFAFRTIAEGLGLDEQHAHKLYAGAVVRCFGFASAAGEA